MEFSCCPDPKQLCELLAQRLAPLDHASLEMHIETCPSCQSLLQSLTEEGTESTCHNWGAGAEESGALEFLEVLKNSLPAGQRIPTPAPIQFGPPTEQGALGRLGDFEIIQELGSGAFGVVYQAHDRVLNRLVAIKVLKPERAANKEDRARFEREAQRTAEVKDDHIVAVHLVGQAAESGTPYIVMEWVDGEALSARLQRERLIAPNEAARIVHQVALGLTGAHERGQVHRDIKPANIMMDRVSGRAKITDFGLARRNESDGTRLTHSGAIVGTPAYMSPEQINRPKIVDGRSDVYSLGVVLYELLTGETPFRGVTNFEAFRQTIHDEPRPPRTLNEKVPRDLETITLKCLAKAPQGRYQGARALADDLSRFLANEPIVARPVSRCERAWRWCRRNPSQAALFAALVLLVIGCVAVYGWYVNDRARKMQEIARIETGMKEGLRQARTDLDELLTVLKKTNGVQELLNQPANWEGQLKSARANLRQAKDLEPRAEGAVDDDLIARRNKLEQELSHHEAAYRLSIRLEKIRMERASPVERKSIYGSVLEDYRSAFADAHLLVLEEKPARIAAALGASPIKEQLLAALDDWAWVAMQLGKEGIAERLLTLGRAVWPDPTWGDRLRRIDTWRDQQAMTKLVNRANVADLSPALLAMMGELLEENHPLRESWYRRAQGRYPADFWLNLGLGDALEKVKPVEAAGFYRVALAVRPGASVAYCSLGRVLYQQKNLPEAIKAYEKAIKLEPKFAAPYNNLGVALVDQKKLAQAIAAYKKAIHLNPRYAGTYFNLGIAFRMEKKIPVAIAAFEKATKLDPSFASAFNNLGAVLLEQNEFRGAIAALQKAVDLNPRNGKALSALANAFLLAGRFSQAAEACQGAVGLLPPNDPLRAICLKNLKDSQEMQALERRLPAVLNGKAPAAPSELLQLASMCQLFHKRHATAVWLYQQAFREEHELVDDEKTRGYRYYAARAAVLAGSGNGTDVVKLNAEEKRRLRNQARVWLQTNFDLYTKDVNEGNLLAVLQANEHLSSWEKEEDLAGVRKSKALATMPEPEREAWRKLWGEVAALLNKVPGRLIREIPVRGVLRPK